MIDSLRLAGIRLRPAEAAISVERHDPQSLFVSVCSEFRKMPGTCLTLPQASRLFGIASDVAIRIFGQLVDEGAARDASRTVSPSSRSEILGQ